MAATTALICRSGDRYEWLLFAQSGHFSKPTMKAAIGTERPFKLSL
jgi:hypothetical protein